VIESGKILFAGGPVTEPALDVRAVRRPQEGILVGSHVRGTLEEPEFTLFSEPPMSQQEQLSYLVLGRSLQEAPAGESSALAQASLAMGVKGGSFLAENLGEDLGLDEFSIQSGSGEAGAASDPADAALVVGKYLSPRLYLSYGIGLFDPVSVLTMQYEINRRLNLKTESSSESTGADLVYSFERGN
jgi:translocation and assembly module TamB